MSGTGPLVTWTTPSARDAGGGVGVVDESAFALALALAAADASGAEPDTEAPDDWAAGGFEACPAATATMAKDAAASVAMASQRWGR